MKFKLFGRTIEIRNSIESLPGLGNEKAWRDYLALKGYVVTASTAVKVAAVVRCVDVVAKTMASLPLHLYKQDGDSRVKAERHRIYKLLHRLPNPETTAFEFWHMYIFNLLLTRGAYAKIKRNQNGFIESIWNIPTGIVRPYRNGKTGEKYIEVATQDGPEILYDGYFMHTPGLRLFDANNPEDPIGIAADVLGLSMALHGYAKDYFENGANLGGIIEMTDALSDEAYAKMQESWQKTYQGVVNQHKTAVLEAGSKYVEVGRDPEKSQALESRKFEVIEICRIFGVPPHKVFELERSTNNNIEHQNTEYVQESIAPMAVRLEQTIYKDLLTTPEQSLYFAKFNVNALLRGDVATRSTYYHNARNDGWMNANDIRSLEDMNPIPKEEGGDDYLINGNMISLVNARNNLPKSMQKGGSA